MDAFLHAMERMIGYMPALLNGSVITLSLTVVAVCCGVVLGLFLALGRISKVKPVSRLCQFYIWFFRGTPLLMQLYFLYYALPTIFPILNIKEKFIVAWIAFALNSGAYLAEIVRAAIQSIDKGQMEASKALGMTYWQAMRHVIIPQSIRRLVPPVGNEFVMVLKDTALVSSIALTDLLRVTSQIQTKAGDALVYIPAMILYLIMTTFLTYFFGRVEKKYSVYE